MTNSVHVALFADFKSSDTLLLEGDVGGLALLVTALRSLGSGHFPVDFETLPFLEMHHGLRLHATTGSRDIGIRRGHAPNELQWELTRSGWNDAADLVEVLCGRGPGHQYLEAANDELVVQVSTGEYGEQWWREHG